MGEWLPIESAPRDEGESMFLWNGFRVILGSPWENGWVDRYYD